MVSEESGSVRIYHRDVPKPIYALQVTNLYALFLSGISCSLILLSLFVFMSISLLMYQLARPLILFFVIEFLQAPTDSLSGADWGEGIIYAVAGLEDATLVSSWYVLLYIIKTTCKYIEVD